MANQYNIVKLKNKIKVKKKKRICLASQLRIDGEGQDRNRVTTGETTAVIQGRTGSGLDRAVGTLWGKQWSPGYTLQTDQQDFSQVQCGL